MLSNCLFFLNCRIRGFFLLIWGQEAVTLFLILAVNHWRLSFTLIYLRKNGQNNTPLMFTPHALTPQTFINGLFSSDLMLLINTDDWFILVYSDPDESDRKVAKMAKHCPYRRLWYLKKSCFHFMSDSYIILLYHAHFLFQIRFDIFFSSI